MKMSGEADWRTLCRLLEPWGVPPIALLAVGLTDPLVRRSPKRCAWWHWARDDLWWRRRSRMILTSSIARAWPCPPAAEPTHTLLVGGRYGRVQVPPDRRADFHRAVWAQLQDPRGALTLVERKAERWRLALDVDLGGAALRLADLDAEPAWTRALVDALGAAFEGWPFRAWVERGPVRALLAREAGGVAWRWKRGLRVYTNAVVDAGQAELLEAFLRRRVELPPWYGLDGPVSFGRTGFRMPGCWKAVACHRPQRKPTAEDLEADVRCDHCQGNNLLLTAPPYPAGADRAAWEARLLWAGDAPVWRVGDAPGEAGQKRRRRMEAEVGALERRHVRRLGEQATDSLVRRTGGDRVPVPPDVLARAPAQVARLHGALTEVTAVRRNRAGFYFFSTPDRACPFRGAPHRSNTLYVVGSPARMQLVLRCHDPDCRGERVLPADAALLRLLWPERPAAVGGGGLYED